MKIQTVFAAALLNAAITALGCGPAGPAEAQQAPSDETFDETSEASETPAETSDETAGETGGELDGETYAPSAGAPFAPEVTPESEAIDVETEEQPAAPAAHSRLGWNLDFVYAGGFVFADKVKMSRSWVSCTAGTWDDGRSIPLDAKGWPTSLEPGQQAVTIVRSHGGGRYVVSWNGDGQLAITGHGGVVSQEPNRLVIDTEPDMQIQLRITAVPVRDIQMRKEGQPETLVWDPVFEQGLAHTKVLRFMQWGMTNGDGRGVATRWAERSKPDWYTQNQRYGVAYEHMIALSNRIGADAWINIPHLADDAYVRALAVMLRDTLNSDLKVYVEWSNEVWNDAYPQAQYARDQGAAAGLGNGDPHRGRLLFQARRTRQVFEIFEDVFSGEQDRLVRVVASQMGNDWNDAQMMGFEGLADHADALAVAPYFGHSVGRQRSSSSVRSGGVGWVMNHLETVALPDLIAQMETSAASAARWGVPLIAYEGGQHVVAEPTLMNDSSVTSVLEEAQRHPKMNELYTRMLEAWQAAGGGLFVHYTYTGAWGKYGYWGALEHNDSPVGGASAHKYRAIVDWARAAP